MSLALASPAGAALSVVMSNSGNNLRAAYSWSAPDTPTAPTRLVLTYVSGGLATPGTSWTLGLSSASQSAASANITFDPASAATFFCPSGVCVSSISPSGAMPEGTYSAVFVLDRSGSPATSTSAASIVTWDSATLPPSMTSPTSSSVGAAGALAVNYTLPEAAKANSVSLTFVPTGVCSGSTVALTMTGSQSVSTTINPASPMSNANVVAVSGTFTAGCTYNVTLSYQDAQNHSAQSVTAVSVLVPGAPGAPTGVSAAAGAASAAVSWTAPADNGATITGYTVTASPGGATCAATVTSCTVTGLTAGTTYTFTVRATNGGGTGAASSASSGVLIVDVPGAPTAVGGTAGIGQVAVTWTAPAANGSAITGYTVTATPGSATCSAAAPSTSCVVTGLTAGGSYTFSVVAANGVGSSAASAASSSVGVPDVPAAPTAVGGTAGAGQVAVAWTAPAANGSAITGYAVAASPGGATCAPTAPATSCVVSGLTPGQSYTFTVVATNAVGTGASSSASSQVTVPNVPGAPTAVTAVAGDGRATASWAAPAANGSPVTSYVVTATPGGSSCGASAPTTTCEITGLANGQAYTFTVVATNAVGSGAASSSSAAVTPGAPPVDPPAPPVDPPAPPVDPPAPPVTPLPQVDAPLPVVPAADPPKAPKPVKLTLRVGNSVTASAVARFVALERPSGSQLRVAMTGRSTKYCRVTRSKSVWRVHGVRAGTCKLTLTLTPKKGPVVTRKITVPVLKKKR